MAMMIGALMIHGIAPGPRVMTDRPGLFWGLIASMWLGNLMLVILNLPLIGLWVRLLRVPYRLLYPAIIVFCCIGAYTINSKPFDLGVMAFFAIFGYVALKLGCEPAPLILGFVLGPMMEENLRRALLISRGDPMVFLQEPISLAFLLVAVGAAARDRRPRDPQEARGGVAGVGRLVPRAALSPGLMLRASQRRKQHSFHTFDRAAMRLEAWGRTTVAAPSFETRAREFELVKRSRQRALRMRAD